jgi:hypothetical protein
MYNEGTTYCPQPTYPVTTHRRRNTTGFKRQGLVVSTIYIPKKKRNARFSVNARLVQSPKLTLERGNKQRIIKTDGSSGLLT